MGCMVLLLERGGEWREGFVYFLRYGGNLDLGGGGGF